MKFETKRMLRKIKSINYKKMDKIVDIISKNNNNKSKLYIKFDIFRNFLKRGIGYTDYFRGDYINLNKEEKNTYVTAKSFYRVIHYLNNDDYIYIFHDKLIFNKFFKEYIKRDYINLKKCTVEQFKEFLEKHDENAKKAMEQIGKLKGCEMHTSVILSEADERVLKKLQINLTSEPKREGSRLYSK